MCNTDLQNCCRFPLHWNVCCSLEMPIGGAYSGFKLPPPTYHKRGGRKRCTAATVLSIQRENVLHGRPWLGRWVINISHLQSTTHHLDFSTPYEEVKFNMSLTHKNINFQKLNQILDFKEYHRSHVSASHIAEHTDADVVGIACHLIDMICTGLPVPL